MCPTSVQIFYKYGCCYDVIATGSILLWTNIDIPTPAKEIDANKHVMFVTSNNMNAPFGNLYDSIEYNIIAKEVRIPKLLSAMELWAICLLDFTNFGSTFCAYFTPR